MRVFLELIAEGFGVGRSPVASGTVATAILGGGTFLLVGGKPWVHAGVLAVITILGTWGAHLLAQTLRQIDPRRVVAGEWAGYLVATLFLPADIYYATAAFVLFRIFDVLKPQPCRKLEELLGGWGIMADDLMAGLYANLLLQVAAFLLA